MVNLLPKTTWEASFWGRVLGWALATGRYIVILTELVVIVAFLSRFKLDQDHSDLEDRINGKQAVLNSMAEVERKFRLVQNRLTEAGGILEGQWGATASIDKVAGKVPPGVTLTDLAVSKKEMSITGTTNDNADLGVFLARLAADDSWKKVSVTGLNASGESGVKFSLKISL